MNAPGLVFFPSPHRGLSHRSSGGSAVGEDLLRGRIGRSRGATDVAEGGLHGTLLGECDMHNSLSKRGPAYGMHDDVFRVAKCLFFATT